MTAEKASTGAADGDMGNVQSVLHLAPSGSDGNPGTADRPFASLERARDEIRLLKKAGGLPETGIVVEMDAGVYELTRPFELTAEDSGTMAGPIVYRAQDGAEVRLVGGHTVTGWKKVDDPAVLARLDSSARGHVWQADLRALKITDLGLVAAGLSIWVNIQNKISERQDLVGENRLELFFQDKPMTLARWPNEGFTRIADLAGGDPYEEHGRTFDRIGKFTYDGDRPERWVGEGDIWIHGYWAWEWAEQRHSVEFIDTEKRTIAVQSPYHPFGYRKGQPFYAFNLLCELDVPGEWYLDRNGGLLYFWPPAPLDENTAVVSVIQTLVSMKSVAHVTLQGLVLEACRGTAVDVSDGTGVIIEKCTIRNTGDYGVRICGTHSGVRGCDIYATGSGGIELTGGDRKTLTPGHLFAEDNEIHHYSRWNRVYKPGVLLAGVRNRVSHNLIHDAPHSGIWFHGNDHVIDFNEFHHLSMETSDAGAIYAGRDITALGNVIHHNYFHHLGSGDQKLRLVAGIYLDDSLGGVFVRDNIFVGTTWAGVCINGGRDNTIENNIFLRCNSAVRGNNGGPECFLWEFYGWKGHEEILQRLRAVPYTEPPWSERYPELVERMRLWEKGEPWRAINNRVIRNLCVESPWEMNTPLYYFEGNWIVAAGPDPAFAVFRNAEHPEGDEFALHPDSPLVNRGFRPIPFDQIGPRTGRHRPASCQDRVVSPPPAKASD